MKKFWSARMQDMTIGQSFLWLLLYLIFIVVVMIAMIMVPQSAEDIWDWVEDKYEKLRSKIFEKKKNPIEDEI